MHYNVNNLQSRDRNCVSHDRIKVTRVTSHFGNFYRNTMHDKEFNVPIFILSVGVDVSLITNTQIMPIQIYICLLICFLIIKVTL